MNRSKAGYVYTLPWNCRHSLEDTVNINELESREILFVKIKIILVGNIPFLIT